MKRVYEKRKIAFKGYLDTNIYYFLGTCDENIFQGLYILSYYGKFTNKRKYNL